MSFPNYKLGRIAPQCWEGVTAPSGVLFTSEGRVEGEINRRIGVASAAMQAKHWTVLVKNLPVSLRSNPHLWSRALGSDRKNKIVDTSGLRLRDRVRSLDTRGRLGVESLLLRIERSQLRWFRHLVRIPPGRLPLEVFQLGGDPENAGGIIYPFWPGNASESPRSS